MSERRLSSLTMRDMDDMARRSMMKRGPVSLAELRAAHMTDADNVSMTDDYISRLVKSMLMNGQNR